MPPLTFLLSKLHFLLNIPNFKDNYPSALYILYKFFA